MKKFMITLLIFELIFVQSRNTSIDHYPKHLILNNTQCSSIRSNLEYCELNDRTIEQQFITHRRTRRSSLRKMLVNKANAHQFLHSIYRRKRFSFLPSTNNSNKNQRIHRNRRSSKQKS